MKHLVCTNMSGTCGGFTHKFSVMFPDQQVQGAGYSILLFDDVNMRKDPVGSE